MQDERSGLPEPDGTAIAALWAAAAQGIEQLAHARAIDEVVATLRISARRIVGANGIAVVLREDGFCHYVAEDAEAPLWAGQRFPAETCVSGWAMMHRQTVGIPDVFADPRVPTDAYRVTFVKSMLMVPIGFGEPVAAIGAYWSQPGHPLAHEVALLETLARAASTALENGRLLASLQKLNGELERRVVERTIDLERAQDNLRQKQKMEVIGQLTGNVAHDFNNLLAPIMSGLDLVLGGRASRETVHHGASIAMEAAENAKLLIERLLAFARRQPLKAEAIDLAALIEDISGLLGSTAGSRVTLSFAREPGLPMIRADRQQLEMAILNLVVNARDAMPSGGQLDISLSEAGAALPEGLKPGRYLHLAIRDTGRGMDEPTRRAAREPFFTTKAAGHGTGLGLSMVDGLVGQLGGMLDIESAPGAGTTVRLWFPVDETIAAHASWATPESAPARPEPAPAERQGELLLVDDEFLVRIGTRAMLADLGYSVTEAESSEKALDLIEEGYQPDIVVTDHIMPGMTGAEFALRLRADHPGIAVIIIGLSGHRPHRARHRAAHQALPPGPSRSQSRGSARAGGPHAELGGEPPLTLC